MPNIHTPGTIVAAPKTASIRRSSLTTRKLCVAVEIGIKSTKSRALPVQE